MGQSKDCELDSLYDGQPVKFLTIERYVSHSAKEGVLVV